MLGGIEKWLALRVLVWYHCLQNDYTFAKVITRKLNKDICMIRTQVQLTNEQSMSLKALATEDKVSMAELIRRSVDLFLERRKQPDRAELKQRTLSVVGKYSSDSNDVSVNHDTYLADAFAAVGQ